MTPVIEVRRLSKTYAAHVVLRQVSLALEPGEHLAVLGPSGCGKSTLLRLIAGLDPPTEGEIWMNGELASRAQRVLVPPHRRHLAMVFQDLALWPVLSVRENVRFGLAGTRHSPRERRQRVDEALEVCAIAELGGRRYSPAVNSSASRWPVRSPPGRASCCWTNRFPPSTCASKPVSTRRFAGSVQPRR